MIEAVEKTVGEYKYTIRQMPATPAYKMLAKLTKLIGPSVKGIIGASGQVDIIAGVVAAFADRLDEEHISSLIKEVFGYIEVHRDGAAMPLKMVSETHFHGGNLSEMFQVIGAFLSVNYADFFQGEAGGLKTLAASMLANARASKSPSTSSGQSGA